MFIRVVNTPILLISSPEVCHDLMEKRSSIYSDRPTFAIDELYVTFMFFKYRTVNRVNIHRTGWDFNLGTMTYGQRWRGTRAYFHQFFNSTITPKYHEKQTVQVHAFLRRCLEQAGKELDPLFVRL